MREVCTALRHDLHILVRWEFPVLHNLRAMLFTSPPHPHPALASRLYSYVHTVQA